MKVTDADRDAAHIALATVHEMDVLLIQTQKSSGDVVLQEIWRIKATLSASYGHDVDRLFAEARERQKAFRPSGRQPANQTPQGMNGTRFNSRRWDAARRISRSACLPRQVMWRCRHERPPGRIR